MSQLVELDLDKPPVPLDHLRRPRRVSRALRVSRQGQRRLLRLIIMLGSRDWDAWAQCWRKGSSTRSRT